MSSFRMHGRADPVHREYNSRAPHAKGTALTTRHPRPTAERLGNGAVFKRLGFLADQHSDAAHIADVCRARLTAGNAKLDTTLRCSRLIQRAAKNLY